MALTAEKLEGSTLDVTVLATMREGGQVRHILALESVYLSFQVELPGVHIPPRVDDELCGSQDIDRLKHYGQVRGKWEEKEIIFFSEVWRGCSCGHIW